MNSTANFIHQFLPASNPEETRTLLLLHGTGGDEKDLIPLGQTILPGAAILSARGRISEGGMNRFFRRFAEGIFDLKNLKEEAGDMAEWLEAMSAEYGFDKAQVTAIGFSNGANMAHSLLAMHPGSLAQVIAIRGMTTFPGWQPKGLEGKRVFLSSGEHDPIVPNEDVKGLATQLEQARADVTLHWENTGHNLTSGDVTAIKAWL